MSEPKPRPTLPRGIYLAALGTDLALIVLGLAIFFRVIPESTPIVGMLPPMFGLVFAAVGIINALVLWLKFGRQQHRTDRGGGTVQ